MQVPFLDFKKQYNSIKDEIDSAIQKVIDSQHFILGPELDAFEKEYSNYLEVKYTYGLNSGTDGLILALKALGVGIGDEVITTTHSFIATALAISEVGAIPVLVDIDPDTYEMDVNQVESKITDRTKAIIPVHLYGSPVNIERILELSKSHNLKIIEDACQSHGALYKGRKAGTFGDISVFSFYPSKNLGAYGDAGALCTNSEELAEKIKLLRNYGQRVKYYHDTFGVNSRMDEVQAAVLRVKLRYLDRWNTARNEVANMYHEFLTDIKYQKIPESYRSVYHVFLIEVDKREELMPYLKEKGIGTLIHYPVPIHLQKCYKNLGYKNGDFPVSERVSDRIVSIPMYPELSRPQIEYVSDSINEFYQ